MTSIINVAPGCSVSQVAKGRTRMAHRQILCRVHSMMLPRNHHGCCRDGQSRLKDAVCRGDFDGALSCCDCETLPVVITAILPEFASSHVPPPACLHVEGE